MDQIEIIDAVYRAAVHPGFWEQTLSAVVDYVGATAGNIVYQSPKGAGSFLIPARMREDLNALYLQQYAHNPYARAFEKVRPGEVVTGNRLIDAPSVRRTAYYRDICEPQDIFNQLFVPHASLHERGGIGGVALFLSRQQDENADWAAARLRQLAPHLLRAMDLSLHTSRAHQGGDLSRRLIDAIPDAALLLDHRGEVILMNSLAEFLLGEADGLHLARADGLVLFASVDSAALQLTTVIRQALSVARGGQTSLDGALAIPRPSGLPPYIAMVTPLAPAAVSLWGSGDSGARVLVHIVAPEAKTNRQAQHLGRMFGLTEAEVRVASLIGSGLTHPEIANRLGISINTVKTHTARCFAKTNMRTQAALARLIAAIPLPDSDKSVLPHPIR